MTIVSDIITLALKDAGIVGVGQTPTNEDSNDALTRCNWMLSQWQRKRWLIWHLVDTAFTSTGAQSYTVGSGGNFNILRPDRLEAAFLRQIVPSQPNLVDYPLGLIEAREEYNRISLKTLGTFPRWAFYDPAYPTGNLFVWPVPSATLYEIHITTKEQLSQFASLAATINLPPEYMAAIHHNLVVRLKAAYQLPKDEVFIGMAKDALNVIKNENAQIPTLQLPAELMRPGIYNPFSDQIY